MATLRITLVGGPTALLDALGLRVLTDPTFDPPGHDQLAYTTPTKTAPSALTPEAVGNVDAVLLSHDQHADNRRGTDAGALQSPH
jgi:L-ascorbate metabolism protein UlaG (beta-lactamase superfamily)